MTASRIDARVTTPGLLTSIAVTVAGAFVLLAGLLIAPEAIAISYLVAYTATLAVVLGMLLLVMIAHLSGAIWFVLLRRRAETVVAALPALAVLMVPLLVAPQAFWPWAAPFDSLPTALQEALRPKRTYFQPGFFITRAILYWIVWLAFGEALCRLSRRQDSGTDGVPSDRLRAISAGGMPLVGFALTFAAFDWMMSLSPGWSSSVYGAYYFAGAIVAALALLAIMASKARASSSQWSLTTEHFQALGRLTLAFVLFWGYLWYAQFFIVWIADIPHEASWYLVRLTGAWGTMGFSVLAAGLPLPFVVLVFRAARGSAMVMSRLGAWLLAVHYGDVYWLLVPPLRADWSFVHLLWDVGALALVGGSVAAVAIWRQASVPSVAAGDPLLEWSVRYEAP